MSVSNYITEAAKRYEDNAYTVADMEALCEYAVQRLSEPSDVTEATNEQLEILRQYSRGLAVDHKKFCRAIEFLIEAARKKPEQRDQAYKIDNGDGTETWRGLSVVVPVGLVPKGHDPVEVRSMRLGLNGAWLDRTGTVCTGSVGSHMWLHHPGEMRIVLDSPITWTPPASLPDGEYLWNADTEELTTPTKMVYSTGLRELLGVFAVWVNPPRTGRYRKVGRVATWIGQ